jgi:thiol-disulfide isomerase/thioredoxin
MHRRLIVLTAISVLSGCGSETPTVPPSQTAPVSFLPKTLDPSCREGRARIYDECGSQAEIFQRALEEAQATGKTVVVSFGAEWCIWCHVFANHLKGATGRFSYPVEGENVTLIERSGREILKDARTLNEFASKHLILAHIEADHAPDGWKVLEAAGAAAHFNEYYPFIFTVTNEGRFAALFEHEDVEVRRDNIVDRYRGYDRRALLGELQRMRHASLRAGSGSGGRRIR